MHKRVCGSYRRRLCLYLAISDLAALARRLVALVACEELADALRAAVVVVARGDDEGVHLRAHGHELGNDIVLE